MNYDIAVIGGGPAGYVSAIKAAQGGAKTILFEKDILGGTCLNRGCIPTKTYLKSAEYIHAIRRAADRGIMLSSKAFEMDMGKALAEKNKVVDRLTSGVGMLMKSNGVEVISERAVIKANRTIEAAGQTYSAKDIIIATGSEVSKPPILGADNGAVVTSDEILSIDYLPEKLTIIGGGVIGVEMAMVFSAFGTSVTIIELMDRLLPTFDEDISKVIHKTLVQNGVSVMTGVRVDAFEKEGDGVAAVVGDERISADLCLISIGRAPCVDNVCEIDLDTQRGFIKVNEYCETSAAGIYAIGDVTGKMMLAHAGSQMGEIAVENILGGRQRCDLSNIPACVYTHPEIGCVGLTEEQVKEKFDVMCGVFPFSANGRALSGGEGDGFVKVVADKKTHAILGVHIVGPNATEMVNEAALAKRAELTVDELADTMHAHPTYSEALMEAAAAALSRCVHLPRQK